MNTEHNGSGPADRTADTSPLTEADVPRSVEEIDAALVRLMAETEETVTRLRAELAERRGQEAQHAEIERLEHHLAEATVNWRKVKEFFEEVLRELTSSRAGETGREADGGDGHGRSAENEDSGMEQR